jgi:hypothetical protein
MLATADYICSSSNYICSFSQSTRMCGYGPAEQRCLHRTQRIRPGGAYSSVRNDSVAAVYSSRGLQPRSTASTVYISGLQQGIAASTAPRSTRPPVARRRVFQEATPARLLEGRTDTCLRGVMPSISLSNCDTTRCDADESPPLDLPCPRRARVNAASMPRASRA